MKLSHFFRILQITILGLMFFTIQTNAVENIDERVKNLTLELVDTLEKMIDAYN